MLSEPVPDKSAPSGFLDTYLPYVLRRADQTLSAAFYDELAGRGVQRSEWRVLAVLHERGSMSMRDLTTVALSPQPTVTHAVTRLEARGLLRRFAGTDDKRQRFVALTEPGTELTGGLIRTARRLEAELLVRAGVVRAGVVDLGGLITSLNDLQRRVDSIAGANSQTDQSQEAARHG